MKGIVFTEFLDLVERKFGFETLDKIILKADLPNEGAYTAVGTYDHQEMVRLVTALSEESKIEIATLLEVYGGHFFSVLHKSYPGFFKGHKHAFDFFETIENYIHPEVLKLYPDAELPRFESVSRSDNRLELKYISERGLHAFAKGLLESGMAHFEHDGIVEMKVLDVGVLFTITLK